jgi:hypothetical protein
VGRARKIKSLSGLFLSRWKMKGIAAELHNIGKELCAEMEPLYNRLFSNKPLA